MSPRDADGEVDAAGAGLAVPIEAMTQTDRKIVALRNYYETLQLLWALEDASAQAALLAGASEEEIEAVYGQAERAEAGDSDERPDPGHEPS
jgi:hypothetical protein